MNKKDKNFVDRISIASQLLLNLIIDIIDFSKIEAGELRLHPKNVEFVALVKEVVDIMSIRADEKKLKISINYNFESPLNIYTDPTRVQQVIANFLANAIKFTEIGNINVNIIPFKKNGSQIIRLEVEDKGIGISEQNSDRIFRKFSQVDESYTRKYGGAGLGLAICKELLHLLGGEIGYNSKFGEGSTFWFELSDLNINIQNKIQV